MFGQPLQGGGLPLLPKRSLAAVEPVATAWEFEQFDRNVVRLHGRRQLPAVLGRHGFVVDGMGQAISMSRSKWEVRNTTPEQGEHTDAILGELGYDAAGIAGLREKKVV